MRISVDSEGVAVLLSTVGAGKVFNTCGTQEYYMRVTGAVEMPVSDDLRIPVLFLMDHDLGEIHPEVMTLKGMTMVVVHHDTHLSIK